MNKGAPGNAPYDLHHAAAVIALAVGMVITTVLAYYLIDILLMLFLGIVIAAALQPGHLWLARWGIPKGLAVLLFYCLFLLVASVVVLFVAPALFEQFRSLVTGFPDQYAQFVETVQNSTSPALQQVGQRLPTFNKITERVTLLFPDFFTNVMQFMTGAASFFVYFVGVLAIGFYWTMEVPRIERLVVSLFPVTRRLQVLTIWHEVEAKLGAFIRGQGIAMLVIGTASALGYWLIGLPDVLVLAVLAGLLEAVPMVGPVFAAIPAIFIALPQGLSTGLLVVGFSISLQLFENNILVPRIMNHSVGISSLLGLFVIFAFGTLYGVLGAFVAIPLTVVVQILLTHILINPDPVTETVDPAAQPTEALRTQLQDIRHRIHTRLQERDSRMQIQSTETTVDQVADTIEQRLEQAVEQVETMLAAIDQEGTTLQGEEQQRAVATLQHTARKIERTLQKVDAAMPVSDKADERKDAAVQPSVLAELDNSVVRVEQGVQHAGAIVAETQELQSNVANPSQTNRRSKKGTREIFRDDRR
jgi:predicted PurR-regulated permease PerM